MKKSWTESAKITDHHGKCRDCGAGLARPETLIHYWNSASYDGMSATRTGVRGIEAVDINAGLCEACQAKDLRARLKQQHARAEKGEDAASGAYAPIGFGMGIFVFTLILLLKALRVDEFGNSLPLITPWFFVWLALDLICIIGLPISIARRNRLSGATISKIDRDLTLSDRELLAKYRDSFDVPYMKIAWGYAAVNGVSNAGDGIAYVSELLALGSPEAISQKLRLSRDLSAYLYQAALQFKSP